MKTAKQILKSLQSCTSLIENNGEEVLVPFGEDDPMIGDSYEDPNKKEDATSDGANGGEGGIGEAENGDILEAFALARHIQKTLKPGDQIEATQLLEGFHFNTKIKQLEANQHPTKIRLALKESRRMLENLLNPGHPSPNPADDESRKVMESSHKKLGKIMEDLNKVTIRKRVKKD